MQPEDVRLASWDAVRTHLLGRYVAIAHREEPDATYAVVGVRTRPSDTPMIVLAQPRVVVGRARLILIARVCPADEVVAEVVLAHGGAAGAGSLVVLDGSLALRHVSSLATLTVEELDASLSALAIETKAFQNLFAGHRATVATTAASTMAHWI